MRNTILLNIAILLALSALAPAATRLVPSDDYPTIQAAIDACLDGDTVIVAPGTYTGEGNRDIDFLGKAITVKSENGPEQTIIDCENNGRSFYCHNGETSATRLEDFTIRNGAKGSCKASSPTISNCVFVSSGEVSGGIYCDNGSNPTVYDCVFAGESGRRGCQISANHSSHITITNCTFTGGNGTAIRCEYGSSATINNCLIYGIYGSAPYHACPAIWIEERDGSATTITNCIISGNYSTRWAAGIWCTRCSPTITNCTIVGNSSDEPGGGIGCYNANPTISNCILWGNQGPDGPQIVLKAGSNPSVSYCNIQGVWPGEGNIDTDPCFVEPGYWDANGTPEDTSDDFWIEGDYRLLEGSPCINAGDPNYVAGPNETDIDGQPRVWDGRVDMGADEFVPPIECAMKFTPQALNPASKGKWVKAHLVLPEGFAVDDVDANTPAVLKLLDVEIQSEYMNVFINEDGLVEIEAAFDRAAFCANGSSDGIVTVEGRLTTGQPFYGTDTIRIVTNRRKYLAGLASHWLRTDCDAPDWCIGLDLNQDSAVNFIDFALTGGCHIEIITQ